MRKKLLVDAATPATCQYDLLQKFGNRRKIDGLHLDAMLVVLMLKSGLDFKHMTKATIFGSLPRAHPDWAQKKLQNRQFDLLD